MMLLLEAVFFVAVGFVEVWNAASSLRVLRAVYGSVVVTLGLRLLLEEVYGRETLSWWHTLGFGVAFTLGNALLIQWARRLRDRNGGPPDGSALP